MLKTVCQWIVFAVFTFAIMVIIAIPLRLMCVPETPGVFLTMAFGLPLAIAILSVAVEE